MTEELSKGFTGIEINGVRFSNIKEMLSYMNKQRVRIINLEKENAELKEKLKKKFDEWIKENGGISGVLYQTFSDDELEHIFMSAYEKNNR